jgi:hypothetical protein
MRASSGELTAPESMSMDIDEKHAATIGRVAAAWAAFEYVVHVNLCLLADFPFETGACVTTQMGIHNVLNAFSALVSISGASKKTMKEVEKFIGRTYLVAQKRNRAIHDTWMLGKDSKQHYRLELTAYKRLVYEFKVEDDSVLLATLSDIKDHISRFTKLYEMVTSDAGVLATLRERYQRPSAFVRRGQQEGR